MASPSAPAAPAVLRLPSARKRWWSLIAIAASVLVVGLDLTVLNLALPKLAADLHASNSDLQWISDAYSLVLAAVMLPAGLLGDRLGRKKVLLVSLVVFGASSAACAYSGTVGMLITFRAILGLGAAAIIPLALSIVPVLFTAKERPKALAVMMGATFVAYPLGPVLGGWLLDSFWWGSVFLINVPVVVLAIAAVTAWLPESGSSQRLRLDPGGIVASSLGLAGLTYGFIDAGENGWGSATALSTMIAGAVVLAGFLYWERLLTRKAGTGGTAEDSAAPAGAGDSGAGDSGAAAPRVPKGSGASARQPLVDLVLFRFAGFTWGTILTTLVSFVMFGMLFALPQYLQAVREYSALSCGLRLLPFIGGMIVGMIAAAYYQSAPDPDHGPRVSIKVLVTIGFLIMAAGVVIGTFTHLRTDYGFIAFWLVVGGMGLGLAMPTATNAALGALSKDHSSGGAAVISAFRQVGATIGVAILGTVLSAGYHSRLHLTGLPVEAARAVRSSVVGGMTVAQQAAASGQPGAGSLALMVQNAFVHGMGQMMWICAAIAVACALLALVFLPRRAAERRESVPQGS
ncbi:MAG: MFS transporter [Actinomycetia bacterium]|nr:MFS transporter [Actinomycetes bacterium]